MQGVLVPFTDWHHTLATGRVMKATKSQLLKKKKIKSLVVYLMTEQSQCSRIWC